VIFYAPSEDEPRLKAHRTEGGRVGFWRDGQLILAHAAKEQAVLSIQRPAVARLLKTNSLSQNDMLIAACAAWAMDMGADLIRAGVKSYGQTPAV
jgi:cyanophycin synthetase